MQSADLERHDRAEALARVRLHQRDGARDGAAVGEPLLADQRRALVRDHRDGIVVGEIVGAHQLDAFALGVEPAKIEQAQIGRAAAARAQHPGADGERLDVVGGEFAQLHEVSSRRMRAIVLAASSVGLPTTRRTTCLCRSA
jgi:hypothetical protein